MSQMKNYLLLLMMSSIMTSLTACSPAEPPTETFIDNQKQVLDKAKQVESIGLHHKSTIDDTVKNAEQN